MRWSALPAWPVALAGLLGAGTTAAQNAPISPVSPTSPAPISPIAPQPGQPIAPASSGHETRVLVPAKVTASSDGGASARVGLGLLRGFGEVTDPAAWDVSGVVEAEVSTTNGLSTLLGVDRKGEVTQAPIGSLRISASLARLDLSSPGGSPYPPFILYVGAAVGRASFSYLGPGALQRAADAQQTLAEHQQVEVPWSAGASAVYVPDGWQNLSPTIEGQIAFASTWAASQDLVSWCTPVGNVERGGAAGSVSTTATDPAQRCTTRPLGAPANTKELSFAAQAGLIDKAANAFWRAAIGVKLGIPLNAEAPEELRFSLRAPFYLTLAHAPEGAEYRGLIRLMPSLNVDRLRGGTTDINGLLELSFLGQRGMFADHFEGL